MARYHLTSVILLCLFFASELHAAVELGYYWLDYEGGDIPDNALRLQCGSDRYVGQVFVSYPDKCQSRPIAILPATVHTKQPYATYNSYGEARSRNSEIKILCSQFPEQFKWVATNATAFKLLPNLVKGGNEVGLVQYFGRVFIKGCPILGKLGLSLAYADSSGHERYTKTDFEVLVYEKLSTKNVIKTDQCM